MTVQKKRMWLMAGVLSASFMIMIGGALLATIPCPDTTDTGSHSCPYVSLNSNRCQTHHTLNDCNGNDIAQVMKLYANHWETVTYDPITDENPEALGYRA